MDISIKCYCGGDHCAGELYIQRDTVDGKSLWMITVVDTSGNSEGSIWIAGDQMRQLAAKISEIG